MTQFDDDVVDELLRLTGAELARRDDMLVHQSDAMLAWIAEDVRASMSVDERARDLVEAEAFAKRMGSALLVRQIDRRLPRRAFRHRPAAVQASVSQSLDIAATVRCVPMMDQAAAAGTGLELWDEVCDTWLELPKEIPPARYLALRVAGDSMLPVLASRDVILVKLDDTAAVNDLVVARLPDGFVVKRLAALSRQAIELASFNAGYPPVVVSRDHASILGPVIARFSREE